MTKDGAANEGSEAWFPGVGWMGLMILVDGCQATSKSLSNSLVIHEKSHYYQVPDATPMANISHGHIELLSDSITISFIEGTSQCAENSVGRQCPSISIVVVLSSFVCTIYQSRTASCRPPSSARFPVCNVFSSPVANIRHGTSATCILRLSTVFHCFSTLSSSQYLPMDSQPYYYFSSPSKFESH